MLSNSQSMQQQDDHVGGHGMVITEEHKVPDRMVGLNSGSMPQRSTTLPGKPQAIVQVKDEIQKIIPGAQGNEHRYGNIEILVPGNKVGLIIGKGGETIKLLQEKAGVKMVIIQDSNVPSIQRRPLRITGDQMKCQRAKEMVMELLASKDDVASGFQNGMGGFSGCGGGIDMAVPRAAVGMVIGRGGEIIKKIEHETGARVHFKTDDGYADDRMCSITGPQDKVQAAQTMIQDLLNESNSNRIQNLRLEHTRKNQGYFEGKTTLPVNIQSNIEKLLEKKFSYKRQGIVCEKLKCIETLSRTWKIDKYLVIKNELNCLKTKLNDKDMISWHHHTGLVNTAGNIAPEIRQRFKPELCTQAWCKFYEIASTFLNFDNLPSLYSVHLCEAPGAFVTSLNHFLLTRDYQGHWDWVAMTFNPYYEGNHIGQMIEEDMFIRSSYDNWYFGEDSTGNLMTHVNLQGLKRITENAHVDLVTADGSIDCQFDPNEQEGIVSRLKHCEVLTALHILSPGGTLVVKLFTMFESESVCLMYLLNCLFEKVTVFKPCTSKGGNSEVYVISQEFKGRKHCAEFLESVTNIYFGDVAPDGCLFRQTDIPDSFFEQHSQCLEFFKSCQMTAIQHNLDLYKKLSMLGNVTFNDPRCHNKSLCHAKQLASNTEVSTKEEVCSTASKVKVTESEVISRLQQEQDYCVQRFFKRYYIKPMTRSARIMKSLNNTQSLSNLRNSHEFSDKVKMEGKFTGSFLEQQHRSVLPWQQKISMIATYQDKINAEDHFFRIQCMSKQLTEDTFKYFEPICGKPVNKIKSSRFCPGFYILQVQEIVQNVLCQRYTQDRRNCVIQKNISEKLLNIMQNYYNEESSEHCQFSDNEFECQEDKQCNSSEPEKETSVKYANNGVNSSHGNNSKNCVRPEDGTCHKNTEVHEYVVDNKNGQMMIVTDNILLAHDMKIEDQMCVEFIAKTPLTPALKFLADGTSLYENTDTLNSVLLYAVPDSPIDDQFEIKDQASLCEIVLDIIKGCPVNASVIIEMGPSLTRVTAGFVYILYRCFKKIGFVHHHGNLLTRHLVCIAKNECPTKKLLRYLKTIRNIFSHSGSTTVLEIVPILTLLEDVDFWSFLDTSNTNLLQSFITTVINKELKHPETDQLQQASIETVNT